MDDLLPGVEGPGLSLGFFVLNSVNNGDEIGFNISFLAGYYLDVGEYGREEVAGQDTGVQSLARSGSSLELSLSANISRR